MGCNAGSRLRDTRSLGLLVNDHFQPPFRSRWRVGGTGCPRLRGPLANASPPISSPALTVLNDFLYRFGNEPQRRRGHREDGRRGATSSMAHCRAGRVPGFLSTDYADYTDFGERGAASRLTGGKPTGLRSFCPQISQMTQIWGMETQRTRRGREGRDVANNTAVCA